MAFNWRMPKKGTDWKISRKNTCGKTAANMGRQHKEALLAAERKKVEKTSKGWGYLEANC